MYTIGLDGSIIYNPASPGTVDKLLKADFDEELNAAGSLSIQFPSTNPFRDRIKPYKSTITIYKNNAVYWEGRCVSNISVDFFGNVSATFEGVLGYLNDTIQPSAKYEGHTIRDFVGAMLDEHNSRVPENRRIYLYPVGGWIDDGQNDRYTEYETTLKCIQDLVEDNGGYMRLSWHEPLPQVFNTAGWYLHYMSPELYHIVSSQYINFGKNLLDFTKNYAPGENFATVVVPLGGPCSIPGMEDLDPTNIASVNDGKIYIANNELVEQYGWIEKIMENKQITNPSGLVAWINHTNWITANINLELEVSAIDLSLLDNNINEFKIGEFIRIISEPHNLDEEIMCTKISHNLLDPAQDKIQLGSAKTMKNISSYVGKEK